MAGDPPQDVDEDTGVGQPDWPGVPQVVPAQVLVSTADRHVRGPSQTDSTYVAGGPSKLIGLAMLTDKMTGHDVPSPVFEFDGAFDPAS